SDGHEVGRKCLEDIDTFYRQLGGDVLGIIPKAFESRQKEESGALGNVMNVIIDTRTELRKAKQWQLSDFIRNKLLEIGFVLDDRPDGTTWKKTK
ncbi:MAG: cysteine--tRNA ligase, partial [Planctomycetota bacterium]